MTTATADAAPSPNPLPSAKVAIPRVFAISAAVAALSLFWTASENHYGQCVAAQAAKYPAIPVSAFQTANTGPLKVAYDAERRKAVGDCKHFLFF